jgi:phosphoribosylanthranilate isomerase
MTKVKLCGLSRPCDIEAANEIRPEYIGFVFSKKSKRYVSPDKAAELKKLLLPDIQTVGVFADEEAQIVADLLNRNIIDLAQLHGNEDESYIAKLRTLTEKPLIKAFRIRTEQDVIKTRNSSADYILLDSGAGTGVVFDWLLLKNHDRAYFLAGGLGTDNINEAIELLHPYAVDVSSGIETNDIKDKLKMAAFVAAARKGN